MKTLTFRFDIDTHKCIRDGVPQLLKLAEEEKVRFSFFLNTGKSVSVIDTIKKVNIKSDNHEPIMMKALDKLGLYDYIVAAIINPKVIWYKKNVKKLIFSTSEVGIHGGRNHAKWHEKATKWDKKRVKSEISYSIKNIRRIKGDYKPLGFASPGWNKPNSLEQVLSECGFLYYADKYDDKQKEVVENGDFLTCIGVNLINNDYGVAFFESCRVRGMNDDAVLELIAKSFEEKETIVLYDHPYYAGLKEIEMIRRIIQYCRVQGIDIVTLGELL